MNSLLLPEELGYVVRLNIAIFSSLVVIGVDSSKILKGGRTAAWGDKTSFGSLNLMKFSTSLGSEERDPFSILDSKLKENLIVSRQNYFLKISIAD